MSKENLKFNKIKISTFFIGLSVIIFSETTIRFISENLLSNLKLIIVPFGLIIGLYLLFYINLNFIRK